MLSHFSVKLINTCKDFIRRCSSIKSIKNSRSAAIFSRMGRGARKRASACTWPFRMMAKRLAPAGQPPQMADFLLQSNKKCSAHPFLCDPPGCSTIGTNETGRLGLCNYPFLARITRSPAAATIYRRAGRKSSSTAACSRAPMNMSIRRSPLRRGKSTMCC